MTWTHHRVMSRAQGAMTVGRPIRAECVLVGRGMRESHGHIRTHAESRAEGWSLTRQTPSEGHRQGRNSAPHAERESVRKQKCPRNAAGGTQREGRLGRLDAELRSEPLCSPGHRRGTRESDGRRAPFRALTSSEHGTRLPHRKGRVLKPPSTISETSLKTENVPFWMTYIECHFPINPC